MKIGKKMPPIKILSSLYFYLFGFSRFCLSYLILKRQGIEQQKQHKEKVRFRVRTARCTNVATFEILPLHSGVVRGINNKLKIDFYS